MGAKIMPAPDAEPLAERQADISPDGIMQLGFGFRGAKVLSSAVELGLFTELAAAPCDGEALRRRLGLHRRGAGDFFDALVALGMLERRDGVYANTPETDLYLDRNKPSYVGGLLELADALIYPVWQSLTEALKTGQPHGRIKDGEDLFDFVYSDEQSLARFAGAMTGSSLPVAAALARRFPWAGHRTVVDVGAAEGGALAEIALAHPHLECRGFDLPRLRPVFESHARRRGLEQRLRFQEGDFLAGPLPSADVLVMGQVLHDWDLEVKRMLLAKAFAALREGGALIVYDQMIDDARRENAAGLLMSLSMLVGTRGGFDYTIGDGMRWVREAGFADARHERLTGSYSMIVATR